MEIKYLLDTDIVIYWLKGDYPRINHKIKTIETEYVSISTITAAELYFGAYNSSQREENISLIDELVPEIQLVAFDEKAGKVFGEIKAELKRGGNIISDSDLFIASVAVSNDMILVSNNERHFSRISELRLENWI